MPDGSALTAVLRKYQTHPEFLGLPLVDPNQRGAVDDTVLHIAARQGAIEDINVMVQHGADVNIVGDMGNTPLHQAAMNGKTESVSRLLELGADPKIRNEFSQTALDVARLGKYQGISRISESA